MATIAVICGSIRSFREYVESHKVNNPDDELICIKNKHHIFGCGRFDDIVYTYDFEDSEDAKEIIEIVKLRLN